MNWKWVTVILGLLLFLAPFVTGYSDDAEALWLSLILSVVVAVLGYMTQYMAAAIVGVIIFLAPWIFGFSDVSSALWSCVLVGGAAALLTGYKAFVKRGEAETGGEAGGVQHHHT